MAVTALKDYPLRVADSVDKFNGAQLLFCGWDQHLMFCAPLAWALPPNTKFGDFVSQILPTGFGAHPDFEKIEWDKVEWLKSGQPWQPDFNKTLAENGLKQKDSLRMRTPGLNGIEGTGS